MGAIPVVVDRGRQAGFTLIEVLIAMAATVMIVTLAFMTFTNLLNGFEGLRAASKQSHEINRAWTLLSRDLRQFVNRPVRDELGTQESAFFGGELADNSISFTRLGWHNPNRLLRSHMQRVRYRLEDETLWRESYPVLDRTDETEAARVELLQGVLAFSVAFLGDGVPLDAGEFDSEDWPRNWGLESFQQGNTSPPEAIEITLELEGFGEVRRLFQIPGVSVQQGFGGGQQSQGTGSQQDSGSGTSGGA
jgi:general secretion pathway protein J